jgi:hypothetical protein
LFSTTSPVRFSKKVFFFYFCSKTRAKNGLFAQQDSFFTVAHLLPATANIARPESEPELLKPRSISWLCTRNLRCFNVAGFACPSARRATAPRLARNHLLRLSH